MLDNLMLATLCNSFLIHLDLGLEFIQCNAVLKINVFGLGLNCNYNRGRMPTDLKCFE